VAIVPADEGQCGVNAIKGVGRGRRAGHGGEGVGERGAVCEQDGRVVGQQGGERQVERVRVGVRRQSGRRGRRVGRGRGLRPNRDVAVERESRVQGQLVKFVLTVLS
jgi:hypothetical protein